MRLSILDQSPIISGSCWRASGNARGPSTMPKLSGEGGMSIAQVVCILRSYWIASAIMAFALICMFALAIKLLPNVAANNDRRLGRVIPRYDIVPFALTSRRLTQRTTTPPTTPKADPGSGTGATTVVRSGLASGAGLEPAPPAAWATAGAPAVELP